MSEKVFDANYSEQYDLLYSDKDYEVECDVLESVFQANLDKKVYTILDLGCGTGNHSIPLARRGYDVTGVDLSPEMLAHAQAKAKGIPAGGAQKITEPVFLQGDLCEFKIDKQFDVALMMFAVLGYQIQNAQVFSALSVVSHHLRPDGLFVFDVWYGPAVLTIKPSDRIKVIPLEGGELIRAASGSLDTSNHTAEVSYRLWRTSGDKLVSKTEERHQMRYFFPQELSFFLQQAGLTLRSLTAFPRLDQPASDQSWNVLGVAVK